MVAGCVWRKGRGGKKITRRAARPTSETVVVVVARGMIWYEVTSEARAFNRARSLVRACQASLVRLLSSAKEQAALSRDSVQAERTHAARARAGLRPRAARAEARGQLSRALGLG